MTSFDPARSAPGSSCADHVPGASRSSVLVTARIVPVHGDRQRRRRQVCPSRSSSAALEREREHRRGEVHVRSSCGSRSSTCIGSLHRVSRLSPARAARAARAARRRAPARRCPRTGCQRRATDSIRALASAVGLDLHLARGAHVANHLAGGKAGAVNGRGAVHSRSKMHVSLLASVGRKSIACTFRSSMRPLRWPGSLMKSGTATMSGDREPVEAPERASGPEARAVIGGDHDERRDRTVPRPVSRCNRRSTSASAYSTWSRWRW